jgi:hypothetical protein
LLQPELEVHEIICSLLSSTCVRRVAASTCSDVEHRCQAGSRAGEPERESWAGMSGRDAAVPSDRVQSTANEVSQLVSSIDLTTPVTQELLQELWHCKPAAAAAEGLLGVKISCGDQDRLAGRLP